MTLITLCHDHEHEVMYCMGDSRITSSINKSAKVLTDFAPKILPLRIQYWDNKKKGHGRFKYKQARSDEFGFAYSGNTLMAMATHGWLVAALS